MIGGIVPGLKREFLLWNIETFPSQQQLSRLQMAYFLSTFKTYFPARHLIMTQYFIFVRLNHSLDCFLDSITLLSIMIITYTGFFNPDRYFFKQLETQTIWHFPGCSNSVLLKYFKIVCADSRQLCLYKAVSRPLISLGRTIDMQVLYKRDQGQGSAPCYQVPARLFPSYPPSTITSLLISQDLDLSCYKLPLQSFFQTTYLPGPYTWYGGTVESGTRGKILLCVIRCLQDTSPPTPLPKSLLYR